MTKMADLKIHRRSSSRLVVAAAFTSLCSSAAALSAHSALSCANNVAAFSFHHKTRHLHVRQSQSFTVHLPIQQASSSALWASTEPDQNQKTKKNSLLQIMMNAALGGNKNSEKINSVQDFDEDLASEIEAALAIAGVTDNCFEGENIEDRQELKTVFESMSNGSSNTNGAVNGNDKQTNLTPSFERKIIKPKPKPQIKAPPHTGLAQVIANQYGIELATVPYSGNKITAADVEYYNFKLTQPPCTPEALELAYKLGLDLNVVSMYVVPDYGRKNSNDEYVMKVIDVEQYLENLRSIRMIERRAAAAANDGTVKSKKDKKLDALDERMEKNIGQLTQKAKKVVDTVKGGLVQQVVQSQVRSVKKRTATKEYSDANNVINGEKLTVDGNDLKRNGKESKDATNMNGGKEGKVAATPSPLFFVDVK